jgi:hypothetical protein
MTPTALRAALSRLGLSQVEAGRLFGYDDGGRSVRKWVKGDNPVPPAVEILIHLMLDGKITVDDINASYR